MGKTEKRDDLFDELRHRARCSFISDMDSRRGITEVVGRARRVMAEMALGAYTCAELCDAAHYLYGETVAFADAPQAEAYFRQKLLECAAQAPECAE